MSVFFLDENANIFYLKFITKKAWGWITFKQYKLVFFQKKRKKKMVLSNVNKIKTKNYYEISAYFTIQFM